MTRRIVTLGAVLLLATLLTHLATAATEGEVEICHVNRANEVRILWNWYAITPGRIIQVPESAVDAHTAHGDSADYWDADSFWAWIYSPYLGEPPVNADCYIVAD